MILYVKGDLFQSPAQVLVNTVNTVGVMGKGIAAEFRRLFPEMYEQYRKLCETKQFRIGMLWLYKSPNKWVLNFPTKEHWRNPSRIEYIEAGLQKFVDSYADFGIYSIAFPPLGCGNGQLDFRTQVQPLMEKYLRKLPIEVFIYPDRKSQFVEHLTPQDMEQWLRTEPTSLPFSEVWDDLRVLLARKQQFHTIAKQNEFHAEMVESPPAIKVIAARQTYLISYETLVTFWQQLRTHGFSARNIAPGLDRELSYITAIFGELEYITPVHISDEYRTLQTAITGLQVLPSAFNRSTQAHNEFEQLTLLS
jgi:O-acetyl-ADP-ribose deacetylase (regulator of RNase III)